MKTIKEAVEESQQELKSFKSEIEVTELKRIKYKYEILCHLLQPVLRIVSLEQKQELEYHEPRDVFINEGKN